MKLRQCSKCKNKLPETTEFFGKRKLKFTYQCKKCKREATRKWRIENPEAYKKSRDKQNKRKREKYKNDPEYKNKIMESERKYVESGGRARSNSKPENKIKAKERSRKRRLDPIKKAEDYENNRKWRIKNKEHLKNSREKYKKELHKSYIAGSMRMSVNDLTNEIIQERRLIIEIKRLLKSNNIKIK